MPNYRRLVRLLLSTAIVATTFALWVRARLVGTRLSPFFVLLVLAIIVAASYVVFGKRLFGDAVDEAKEIRSTTEDSDEQ
ncbi:hypothetical protein ACFQL1_01485 [Halomicroarcula sp. GCM10025709]|uniref:hypothetical protein n=1 Tax=Haloarcula TaxID=2237 RepID=UPI0024C35C4A|nr:hypothetical protein [Halomicroarcula sp. YJ-61-S]